METLYQRCCGIDVHQQRGSACLLTPGPGRSQQQEIRSFGTTTSELLDLRDWLLAAECTHVAMESTGVYVRRITARAIPPAGRLGSEGNPGVNNLTLRRKPMGTAACW